MPQRVKETTRMGTGTDWKFIIQVFCPIPTCSGRTGVDGGVTFVISKSKEMPGPSPCNECGVAVYLTEANLREVIKCSW